MEVGPLNNIRPPVEGPTEGQSGRATDKTSQGNRLVAEAARTDRLSGDALSIAMRNAELTQMQEKVGIGSVARDAILTLINSMNDIKSGDGSQDDVKQALVEIGSLKFNGKPVFSGEAIEYTAADGTESKAILPKSVEIEKVVLADLKSLAMDLKNEPGSIREINSIHKQLSNLINELKAGVKDSVVVNNKQASMTNTRQVDNMEKFINDIKQSNTNKMPSFREYRGMSDKAVKLLK